MSNLQEINQTQTFTLMTIGDCANDRLHRNITAQVVGITSKGIFLKDTDGKIIFITCDKYRGPLTLNLIGNHELKNYFSVGEYCLLNRNVIVFSKCNIVIPDKITIWYPSQTEFNNNLLDGCITRCFVFARTLSIINADSLFTPFLEEMSNIWNGSFAFNTKECENIYRFLPTSNIKGDKNFSETLLGLIGYGPGLTPAGDDFIIGYILTSFYLNKTIKISSYKRTLIKKFIRSAKKSTTDLSYQLIKCASLGKADERILKVLHWVALGDPILADIQKELLSYGSSSGIDTFAGILTAVVMR